MADKWARWLHHPCRLGDPHRFRAGGKIRSGAQVGKVASYINPAASGIPTALELGATSDVAHKWARWLHDLYRLGHPHRFTSRGKIRSGPQVSKVATSLLPPRGSPPIQSERQNQKWPTSGQGG